MVSAENWVGLILAPLRLLISAMVPELWADCTPESEERLEPTDYRAGQGRARRLCSTAILQPIPGSYFCADP